MGWTSCRRVKGQSNKEYFGELLGITEHFVEVATVKGVVYGAVRDEEDDSVRAVVILTNWSPKDSYYNFSYKTMSESMGPCYYDAPARVLDELTETTSEYALQWREKCRAEIKRKSSLPAVKKGDVIEFDKEITFTDESQQSRFIYEGYSKFRDPVTGTRYRISNFKNRGYTVIR